MHGAPLASNSDKGLAIWTACERDNIPIGAAPKRNGFDGTGGSSYVVDVEYLAGSNDEFHPGMRGKCA